MARVLPFRQSARRRPSPQAAIYRFWPEARPARGRRSTFVVHCLAAVLLGLGIGSVVEIPAPAFAPTGASGEADAVQASTSFTICHTGGGQNCVVDGDTFYHRGEKIRIADIDAPETHPARCAEEDRIGTRATERLAELLGGGPFTLEAADRPTDKYGRRLAVVMRDGQSIGGRLVDEGLAREWEGARRPWC